jgi:ribosomal protein L31
MKAFHPAQPSCVPFFSFFFLLSLYLVSGCGGNENPSATASTTKQAADSVPTFSQINIKILTPSCSNCHPSYTAYSNIKRYIIANDSASSLLYMKVFSGEMPQEAPPLSSDLQTLLKNWIDAGALNN